MTTKVRDSSLSQNFLLVMNNLSVCKRSKFRIRINLLTREILLLLHNKQLILQKQSWNKTGMNLMICLLFIQKNLT